jgi:hypothetical protein
LRAAKPRGRGAPLWAAALSLVAACALQERADYLIGRECSRGDSKTCDQGEVCLPHSIVHDVLGDYRCRSRASFDPIDGREAPLAYCDPSMMLNCPGDLVCNADRVREDATTRHLVCTRSDSPFSPPLPDGGVDGGA